jgi:regulator of ribosome biosynthesis
VDLPEPKLLTPRSKPAPKEKPKTKWEKFREERGLPARKKRSRLIFDPITNDWVPRWGPGSKKKIEAKHEWLLEDKPGVHDETDPFTVKRQEKKLE